MHILSIHFGHDASLALMQDGRLTAFCELERTTRLKHQLGVHSDEIAMFLGSDAVWDSIDCVAITATQFWGIFHSADMSVTLGWTEAHHRFIANKPNWQPQFFIPSLRADPGDYRHHVENRGLKGAPLVERVRYTRGVIHGCPQSAAQTEATLALIARSIAAVRASDAAFQDLLAEFLMPVTLSFRGRAVPGFHVGHHYAHACYAHFYAASDTSLVVSHDGGLAPIPYNAGGLYLGEGERVYPLMSPKLFLGNLYDQASVKAGFNEADGPGKLMGLAPYGAPSPSLEPLIAEAKSALNPERPIDKRDVDALLHKLVLLSGAERNVRGETLQSFRFDFKDRDFSITLAANTQHLVERVFAEMMAPLVSRLSERFPDARSLAVVGGFALNCPANTLLQASLAKLAVNPLPGAIDSGLAIGGAAAIAMVTGDKLDRVIAATGNKAAFPPQRTPTHSWKGDARLERVDPDVPLPQFLAGEILRGKIVCLHRGRSEIGPRALGHRSILAKASAAAIRDTLNTKKGRENWRPLAPIVHGRDFARYFRGDAESCRFMLFTYPVAAPDIPGITHVDGTARVQTIGDDDALLSGLLAALAAAGEPPVIINTSFNTAGEPIVESGADACESFLRLGADWLVVADTVYRAK